eukprot:9657786-Alexandrium_andersonii.AAC.1
MPALGPAKSSRKTVCDPASYVAARAPYGTPTWRIEMKQPDGPTPGATLCQHVKCPPTEGS